MKEAKIEMALKESRFFKDFNEETIAKIAAIGQLVALEAGDLAYQVFKPPLHALNLIVHIRHSELLP